MKRHSEWAVSLILEVDHKQICMKFNYVRFGKVEVRSAPQDYNNLEKGPANLDPSINKEKSPFFVVETIKGGGGLVVIH